MSFVIGPSIQVGSRAGQAAITTISRQPFVAQSSRNISNFFSNLFKGITPATKSTVTAVTKKATIPTNLLSKTNVITGGILGTTLASTLFLSSPQGQNTVNVAGQGVSDVTNLGKSVNDLLTKNPLIPIGLLILGGLVVVSVIKK